MGTERPNKNLRRWLSAIAAFAFVATFQLVSKSLSLHGGATVGVDSGRKLHLRTPGTAGKEGTLPENLLHLKNKQISMPLDQLPKDVSSSGSPFEADLIVQPRAFEQWPIDRPLPCFPPDGIMIENGPVVVRHNYPVSQGFFFLKTYKTGSSTSAGVNLRIARNVARRQHREFDFCKARYDHAQPWKFHGATLFGNRTIGESFLWGILRDPTKRAISQFFHFKVSRFGWEPNDENFLKTLRVDKKNNYVRSLSLRRFYDDQHDGFDFANQIIQDYDFIGVTERIDESFVALAMLLRIPLSDVLYLSAKLNGGYDDHCFFIQPSSLTPGMKKFLESDEWRELIKEDLALYEAANQSLDMTIERLGREKFEHNLAKYKAAVAEGNKRCRDRTVFPCTKDGKRVPPPETDCLWSDAGCGAECLDEVAIDAKLDEQFWNSRPSRERPKSQTA